ncbi:DUF1237 domain-containing protein [Hesseltinella vesiculosa]|uniref:DUF1237 domain-containing protein n=1 Tax=Hesseltinella vesiculosa TaxID=101127 RepID=A0A1X2GLU5_9FUNG|nr:DUF1237 domain-containing protein [Hesseltinella vesiculosa]
MPAPTIPFDPPQYGVPRARLPIAKRKFHSPLVDDYLAMKTATMKDKDLATLLENCLPNTLDTTIEWYDINTKIPHTFLITGDIPAMWIRDSTNQILPYLTLMQMDATLKKLVLGVLQTQADYLHYDPYANAFLRPWYASKDPELKGTMADRVLPQYDGRYVWESKYELDSLGHFLLLTNEYITVTEDSDHVFGTPSWLQAMQRVLQVIQDQMRGTWEQEEAYPMTRLNQSVPHPLDPRPIKDGFLDPPAPVSLHNGYRFQRYSDRPTETLGADGLGGIGQRCGLVKSAFRPSDDATTFPYLIPANAQMSSQLKRLAQLIRTHLATHRSHVLAKYATVLQDIALESQALGDTIHQAIYEHAVVEHPVHGRIFAYEVDCYGSHLLMDDANTPSLMSLPLMGFLDRTDPTYQRTRRFLLSRANPWYFQGKLGQGIGSPHTGHGMIWPMSILVQIQTSVDEHEIRHSLDTLKKLAATATSGFMVESFHQDDLARFTRPWFSWANGFFGVTMADLEVRFPSII